MSSRYGGFGQGPYGQPPTGSPYPPGQQIPPYQPQMPGVKQRSSGCSAAGCLVGCLVVAGIMLLTVLGLGCYGVYWVKQNLLEDTAYSIQAPKLSERQQEDLKAKLAPILKAFKENTGEIFKLSLTQDEVNWILNYEDISPETKEKMKVAFEFPEDGIMDFRACFSTAEGKKAGPPYVNVQGRAEFEVAEGAVKVKLRQARISKFNFSSSLLDILNESLSQALQTNQDVQWIWERLRDAKIEKGLVHLTLKALKAPEK